MLKIYFKKTKPEAIIPKKGSKDAAGHDLFALVGFVLHPGERKTIMTGISMKSVWTFPNNPELEKEFDVWTKFEGCSGNAHKHGLDILAGVIDSDFRGELGVVMVNTGDHDIVFSTGDKLAQAIFIPRIREEISYVVDSLDDTERGSDGFGSTGIAGDGKNSSN